MKLAALQATFHRVLRGDDAVEAGAAALGCDPRRLAIYRDFVRGHVQTALDKNFVVTRELLAPVWPALSDAYFRDVPPGHWELNAAAESFPAWLETQVGRHEGLLPFHVDLASFEWEEFAAYAHPAEMPAHPTAPAPNPTAAVLQLAHPVAGFVKAWNAGRREPPPAPLATPQLTFLFRHPRTGRVMYQVATDDLLFALKVAAEGLDPVAAAASIGQPAEAALRAMAFAADVGLIVVAPG